MCEPTTIAIGMMVAGGALQAKASIDAGNFEAKMAKRNAALAEAQADDARRLGTIEEQRVRDNVRRTIGRQRVTLAANNVESTSGSALDMVSDTAALGAQDAYLARSNALRQAWGFGVEASNSLAQGAQARAAGRNQALAGLLTTGAQAYGVYKQG